MIIYIIIIGLVIGSFINVCIYRIQLNQSIVKPRSKCPECNHQLKFWENIPILSYFFLLGKCSNCKTTISLRYPFVELLTSIIFVLLYLNFGYTLKMILFCILFSLIIVITFIDIDVQIIPNGLLILCLIPVTILVLMDGLDNIWLHILGAIILSGGFLLIGYLGRLIYKMDAMGMGDVKYVFILGLLLGWKFGILAIGISFLSAALIVIILFITKKLQSRQKISFGPFLSIGLIITILWGEKILKWYLSYYN